MTTNDPKGPSPLAHALERTVLIRATRATVFRFFTDPARFAGWWGAGSHIEGVPGGAVRIRYPNGVLATGQVVEVVPDRRIVFTYGYEDPAKPIAPGASRVTISLEDRGQATLLRLRHELADAPTRDAHGPGWRFQLALFANVAASDQHAQLAPLVDRFLALWSDPDASRRLATLAEVATDDLAFRDAFACLEGPAELAGHIGAAQLHMPGLTLTREGEVRHCQGVALADWIARAPGGEVKARGTNVFDLAADGRICRVVGLWPPR